MSADILERSPRPVLASPAPGSAAASDRGISRSELNAGLLAAAKLGRVALVEACLDAGADGSAADSRGFTALHWAAFGGFPAVLSSLRRRGEGRAGEDRGGEERAGEGRGRVVNSPLHWAACRGQLTCAWLLLAMGYSPLEVDACGNNAMHLACACTTASKDTQLAMIRTLMYAGFDPDARNWYAQKAIDLLPSDAVEARRLLTRAADTTRCAATGVPFGSEELRYLCHSSGAFFCEEASVAASVRALPPSQDELHADGVASSGLATRLGRGDIGDDDSDATDSAAGPLLMPVRIGSDIIYKLADAETALETALNPFLPPPVLPSLGATLGTTLRSPVRALPPPPPEKPATREPPPPPSFQNKMDLKIGAIAEEEEEEEDDDDDDSGSDRPRKLSSKLGFNRAAPVGMLGADAPSIEIPHDGPAPQPPRELTPPEKEPYLYFTKEHLATLQQCASTVSAMKGDVALLARHALLIRRIAAARRVVEAVTRLNEMRPLKHRNDTMFVLEAISEAQQAGLKSDSMLLEEARTATRMAITEVELAACIDVVKSVAVATHANDADVFRIRAAVSEANRLNEASANIFASYSSPIAVAVPSDDQQDQIAGASGTASVAPSHDIAEGEASIHGDEETHNRSNTVVRTQALTLAFVPVQNDTLHMASALADRLTCEIGVTDAMDAAVAACAGVKEAVVAHGSEDPTLLPTPELTPEEATAVKAALDAYAAALAAPPPKPKPGTKPPAVPPPPPKPMFPTTRFQLDINGVPLPETPQLISILALQVACEQLAKITVSAKSSGADDACIAAAELALKEFQVEATDALASEKDRVALARVERAKLEKKGKKKASKK